APGMVERALRRLGRRAEPVAQVGGLAELEHERAAGRAERLVDAGQHPAQAVAPVDREKPGALLPTRGAERLERPAERLAAQHGTGLLVELVEGRVDPGREPGRAEESGAEPMGRRDP